MIRSLEAMAAIPDQRAAHRGSTARRLLAELLPFKRDVILALALVSVGAIAQAVAPWLIGHAIDTNITSVDPIGLAQTVTILLCVYGVATWASRLQIYLVGSVGQRVLAALRARLFAHFQRLPIGYFDQHAVGDLISRVTNDVDTLNQLFSQGLTQLLGALFGLVGIIIAMLVLNVPLALVSFTVIPGILLTTTVFSRLARRAFRTTRVTTGEVTAELQEEIVGVREAQAFNRTEANITRFQARNLANRNANVSAVAITSAFVPAIDLLGTIATAIVIAFGCYLAFDNRLTVGLLAAFLIYVQQFFRPIQLISQVYTLVQAALAGGERIFAILDEPEQSPDGPGSTALGPQAGKIDFDHVEFAYEPGRPVLRDLTFTAEAGQTVALVGRTGAGKTTIANLIARFYDVTQGAVRVGGHDVREVTRESLRGQIAMVLQEPFLFSGTLAENIAYGRDGVSREEVEAAARTVDADAFIRALPQGYDTMLGELGGTLSQGQRQLVSFARAILRDPRILILDEATSNIDSRTESLIQKALATLLAGRTSIVIAHRLSTIRHADLILVIEDGQIVERGTHAELLAAEGRYADLYRRQFLDPHRQDMNQSSE